MKRFLISTWVLLAILLHSFAGASPKPTKDGEIFPWPWGLECPFPWSEIPGYWQLESKTHQGYFEFIVSGKTASGGYILEVTEYSLDGEAKASGWSYSEGTERHIQVAMQSMDDRSNSAPFWAIVRTFADGGKKSQACNKASRMVIVLTIRPLAENTADRDSHYVIKKLKN